MTNPQTEGLLALPYSQRQLVIVQPDDVVVAAREAEKASLRPNEPIDWKAVVARVGKVAYGLTIFGAIEVTIETLSAWAKAREAGLNVLQISRSESQELQFPPGHPRDQVLYVAHPALPSVYYTAATFHRMAFEHKFSEAILLLMSLGASRIAVEHIRGWSREFSSQLSAPISSVTANLDVSGKEKSSSSLLFEASLENGLTARLPERLVWYPHEPTWQVIAKGRLEFGMQQFSLTVNYEDDFGVNAGLKLRVQKAGLDVGGAFEDHTATTWKIHGKFG